MLLNVGWSLRALSLTAPCRSHLRSPPDACAEGSVWREGQDVISIWQEVFSCSCRTPFPSPVYRNRQHPGFPIAETNGPVWVFDPSKENGKDIFSLKWEHMWKSPGLFLLPHTILNFLNDRLGCFHHRDIRFNDFLNFLLACPTM